MKAIKPKIINNIKLYKMKRLIKILMTFIVVLTITSCEEENSPIFVAQEDIDGIEFVNTFASTYLISEETKDNIADRIIWNSPEFGVPTNIIFEIQGSLTSSFDNFDVIGATSETNYAIIIEDLLDFAYNLNLDNDPNTVDADGNPNNVGEFFIRIRANVGTVDNLET